MADDQTINPVPWWATGGPARITVYPYQPANNQSGPGGATTNLGGWPAWTPERDAWFPDDWLPPSAPANAGDSDDRNAGDAATPIPATATRSPSSDGAGTRYLDPFTQYLIASLARLPTTTREPLVSPELSNAVVAGVPIFPKDILGFDPNRIPAAQWPTTPPIFLHDWLGDQPANPPPSRQPFSPPNTQALQFLALPDIGRAATHSLLALTAPSRDLSSQFLPPGSYTGLFPPPPAASPGPDLYPLDPNLNALAPGLSGSGWSISKTGTRVPPPPVQAAIFGPRWRGHTTGGDQQLLDLAKDVGAFVAPFTSNYLAQRAAPPVTGSTPGKIPPVDPDPVEPFLDVLSWLGPAGGKAGTGLAAILGKFAARAAETAAARKAAITSAVELGRLGEEAVGIPANAPKPSIRISGSGVVRFPDRVTEETIEEVKNVAHLSFTQQLRDYLHHAKDRRLTFILHVRPETTYSGPLQTATDAGLIERQHIPKVSR